VEEEGRFLFFELVAKKGSGIPLRLTRPSEVGEICGLVKSIVSGLGSARADDGKFPHFQRSFHVPSMCHPVTHLVPPREGSNLTSQALRIPT